MIARRPTKRRSGRYVYDEEKGAFEITPRNKLLERMPPTVPPFRALEDIHFKLAKWTEFYENYGDGGRGGVYFAINDVCEFFVSRGIPAATLAPLYAAATAICDADNGTESPIFKPDRSERRGRPRKSAIDLYWEGHLAAVTECCVRHRQAEGYWPFLDPGCQLAQSLIRESDWPISPTVTELREIRERVSAQTEDSPDRIAYDVIMSGPIPSTDPLTLAKSIVDSELVPRPPSSNFLSK